jgi:coenzyme F420-reducing hydrogenase delta subunit
LEPERVKLFNLSAAMAGSFVTAVKEMHDMVLTVGRNPLRRQGEDHDQE